MSHLSITINVSCIDRICAISIGCNYMFTKILTAIIFIPGNGIIIIRCRYNIHISITI